MINLEREKLEKAAILIAASSIYLNCAINNGLKAKEIADECLPSAEKEAIKVLANMVTRLRHDSSFLEKKMKLNEANMDFLYDTFFEITDLVNFLVILTPEELLEVRKLLTEMTIQKLNIVNKNE